MNRRIRALVATRRDGRSMELWRGMRRAKIPAVYVLVGMCLGAALSAAPAVATITSPPGDVLGVVSLHASVSHAAPGATVIFTEVIHNYGATSLEMDTITHVTGGTIVNVTCDLGVSADTPACEYSNVAPGTSLTSKFYVKVTGASGSHLTVKGGVNTQSAIFDQYPFDQYLTSSIPIN